MIIRSKAPLRLGLAGGGTDVSPYSDIYGGAIVNTTIDSFAYCSIRPLDTFEIKLRLADKDLCQNYNLEDKLPIENNEDDFILIKGVYNYLLKTYNLPEQGFEIITHADAPIGSGLGTSSTIVVAILGAFVEWLRLPLGEYNLAHMAYVIERIELRMAGGKQDQYAAAFGGFNYMEFFDTDKVIVNPLGIKQEYINELENNLLLYYTETSRLSSSIIAAQQKNVSSNNTESIAAMHQLKEQSIMMKEALLKGNLQDIGKILDYGWHYKKQMATDITSAQIDETYTAAKKAGATGGKISGAGGGGHMILYCPSNCRHKVIKALAPFKGHFHPFHFTKNGLTSWVVQ